MRFEAKLITAIHWGVWDSVAGKWLRGHDGRALELSWYEAAYQAEWRNEENAKAYH